MMSFHEYLENERISTNRLHKMLVQEERSFEIHILMMPPEFVLRDKWREPDTNYEWARRLGTRALNVLALREATKES